VSIGRREGGLAPGRPLRGPHKTPENDPQIKESLKKEMRQYEFSVISFFEAAPGVMQMNTFSFDDSHSFNRRKRGHQQH
jgi:hypothetical protein